MVPLVQLIWGKFLEAVQPVRWLGHFCSKDPIRPWEIFLRNYPLELQAREVEWVLAPCQVASSVSAMICGGNKTLSRLLNVETHSCMRGWDKSQRPHWGNLKPLPSCWSSPWDRSHPCCFKSVWPISTLGTLGSRELLRKAALQQMPFLVEGLHHLCVLITQFGLGITTCLDQNVLSGETSHHF